MQVETELNRQKILEMFRIMLRIRAFENEAIELAKANLTRAAVHTYNGEEAIAAGVCACLRQTDYIVSTHRGHGHCIAKGADIRRMFAELMARETGYCKGKGGSMHIADLSNGMLGANGIVGGGLPIAVGAALGVRQKGSDQVTVCFFGDGASNEGSFHEALNLASIWSLPVIFVCENNQYGISTPVSRSMNIKNISIRAKAYGMKGITLDGNKIDTIYSHMSEIVELVRQGGGPVLVEMKTYRMSGHYFGDNENYRSKDEVAGWKKKDPILYAQRLMQRSYDFTEQELKGVEWQERQTVLAASEAAKTDPFPLDEALLDDLYDPTFQKIDWKVWRPNEGGNKA